MKRFLLMFVLAGCSYTPKPDTITKEYVTVTSVHDGDTFTDIDGNHYRLAGLDCPELGQEYGFAAQAVTSGFILNRVITVKKYGKDKYDRYIVDVWYNDVFLNELLVRTGYAWVYKYFGNDTFYQIMLKARARHLGIWHDNNPEPPFVYRNRIRNTISLRPF